MLPPNTCAMPQQIDGTLMAIFVVFEACFHRMKRRMLKTWRYLDELARDQEPLKDVELEEFEAMDFVVVYED